MGVTYNHYPGGANEAAIITIPAKTDELWALDWISFGYDIVPGAIKTIKVEVDAQVTVNISTSTVNAATTETTIVVTETTIDQSMVGKTFIYSGTEYPIIRVTNKSTFIVSGDASSSTGSVTIEPEVWQQTHIAVASQPQHYRFEPPITTRIVNKKLVITLPAGGASVTGKLVAHVR